MEGIYLPEPTTEIWEQSAKGFREKWQFPNCIGAIDGRHVTIKCPNRTGSNYFCYLNKFSIVLMAIVDPYYKFICVDIGGFGKNSDGGIFEASNMGQRFEANLINVPNHTPLPGQNEPCPHVLIGDEAFALKPYLMRPFPYRQSKLCPRKENYNVRLCRARRVVENAFGILSQKWRIFLKPITTKVETTILIIKTACVLHNFLRVTQCDNPSNVLSKEVNQTNHENVFTAMLNDSRRATNIAFNVREKFVGYCNP
nr:protein ALP1-like [Onthophagus taurus]XP_022911228.1 protein ALP1-like [Onthophagus taurus]